jgi:hypothetical protein
LYLLVWIYSTRIFNLASIKIDLNVGLRHSYGGI